MGIELVKLGKTWSWEVKGVPLTVAPKGVNLLSVWRVAVDLEAVTCDVSMLTFPYAELAAATAIPTLIGQLETLLTQLRGLQNDCNNASNENQLGGALDGGQFSSKVGSVQE